MEMDRRDQDFDVDLMEMGWRGCWCFVNGVVLI